MRKLSSMQFSKLVVVFSIMHLWIFTWVIVILSGVGVEVPDSIIVANFGFFGTELVGLLILKVARVRRENPNE